MTVAELVAKLNKYPPDMPIVAKDVGGFETTFHLRKMKVIENDEFFYEYDNRFKEKATDVYLLMEFDE